MSHTFTHTIAAWAVCCAANQNAGIISFPLFYAPPHFTCLCIGSKFNLAQHTVIVHIQFKLKTFCGGPFLIFGTHTHSRYSRIDLERGMLSANFKVLQYIFGGNLEYLVNITVHFLLRRAILHSVCRKHEIKQGVSFGQYIGF